MKRLFLSCSTVFMCIILVVFSSCDSGISSLPKKIDYNFHVRPILSDKCFACHGPDEAKRESGLRLDTQEGAYAALKDQENAFAIIPGDADHSELVKRIFSEDSTISMPPPEFNVKLTEFEKNILKKWIEQGAEYKPHWAFIPPDAPTIPTPDNATWANNEIDLFVLNVLDEKGLIPNSEADKERLLKRVSFDLTGLPPSIELQNEFLANTSTNAYEEVVDKLLSMPEYGEKMAAHWMDVARYADSHGYQDDGLRTMWPWRDWVIHAFNSNYPYDKFISMQLAGDLLPNKTKESILASGFNRNHKITQEGGVIDEEYRIEYVTDRTNTFGKAFLGLTFECAKCHDHKYDPISQREYFGTFAFFNSLPEKGLFGTIDASFADPPNMEITPEMVKNELNFINLKDTNGVMVMVMKDSVNIRKTHLLSRGAYDSPAEQVTPSTPVAIMPFDTMRFEQNRLGLTKWLLDDKNPLTARVFVNRVWQEIFGRGLVKTSGDFGMQGDFPTHPELLDYLAFDFKRNNWDIKYLVKKIVMSSTYRQSADVSDTDLEKDPENSYYARYKRKRLNAEEIRDHILASSGLLHKELGGPSVKPYQPEGLWESATSGRGTLQNYVQDKGNDLYRRGLYTFIKRTVPPPTMLVFDASNRDQCEVQRLTTNTPLQALIMLNDPTVLEASRVFADNIIGSNKELDASIEWAFRSILCRKPSLEELEGLKTYYNSVNEQFKEDPASAEAFIRIGEYKSPEVELDHVERASFMQLVHTIYNLEEAITKG